MPQGILMFYRLLLYYFRLKLIRILFELLMNHQKVQKSPRAMQLLSVLESFITQYVFKKALKKYKDRCIDFFSCLIHIFSK